MSSTIWLFRRRRKHQCVALHVLSILVIVCVIIYCVWIFVLMWRRDSIYFDQLKYLPDGVLVKPERKNSLGGVTLSSCFGLFWSCLEVVGGIIYPTGAKGAL